MIQSWLSYLLRQTALAGTVLVVLFLLAEILAPGSVLPFLNLHAFVIGTLVLHSLVLAAPSEASEGIVARMVTVIPIALLLFVAVWFALWGAGNSAMLLALAVSIIILAFAWAISASSPNPSFAASSP
ncbi:MAG: hypothetical protein NUW08_01620 [Candidatus Uhrbacteria bacterium]|nr:hypothetical protein [Candidatus Uhrbacteria bacterium]